jgi:hypothetical protein
VVGGRALELDRVFEDHEPVGRAELGDLGQESVGEGGLPGAGAAGDEDVVALENGLPKSEPVGPP